MIRNCPRCGKDFESPDRYVRLICDNCRSPGRDMRPLSFRERQLVTMLYLHACSNKEMAARLNLSEGTVKEYMNRIFRKVQVGSRLQLFQWARDHPDQLVPPEKLESPSE